MSETAAWLIFLLPLASFVIIAGLRPLLGPRNRLSGLVTTIAVGGSFVLSLVALKGVIGTDGHDLRFPTHRWLEIERLTINVGIVMNSLTAVMAVIVTGVSLLVQIYSQEYMRGDKSQARYYASMSLFTASMLGLVMASNLVLLFVFWELVGLCSYLLIGHWIDRPAAANAAKKAFIVTRLGDLGFLIAIVWAYLATSHVGTPTFEIAELNHMAETGVLAGAALTWLALGVFAGAVGKSGQFPLHVWLPDAMEGPTPVSALIHAATMVAAGVFLVARMYPLFEHSPTALTTVAWIGGFTAIFAATMAIVASDIKRVMAYSTVSQLGYMMMALGLGAMGAAIFHLFNHAFFKALLFLGAGSVQHTTGTYNMRFMGGLRKAMPWTFMTVTVAALSLSGIPPFSGFWSKDSILGAAWSNHSVAGAGALFWIALVTAALTAFYVFRMIFNVFTGEFRGGGEAERASLKAPVTPIDARSLPMVGQEPIGSAHAAIAAATSTREEKEHHYLHESPWVMALPLLVLAVPAVLSGVADFPWALAGIPAHWMTDLLGVHGHEFNTTVALISSVVALGGIGLAYLMYVRGLVSPARFGQVFRPAYVVLSNRYYIDRLYEDLIVRKVLYRALARTAEYVDTNIVDRVANIVGWLGRNLGRAPAMLQTGQAQMGGVAISAGLIAIVVAFWIWS